MYKVQLLSDKYIFIGKDLDFHNGRSMIFDCDDLDTVTS